MVLFQMLEMINTFAFGPDAGSAWGIPITLEFVVVAVLACSDLSVSFQFSHLTAAVDL